MRRLPIFSILVLISAPSMAPAQAPATQPATAADEPAAPRIDEPLQAKVVKATPGRAFYALVSASGERGPWQEAKPGDMLPAGTRIRTRLRGTLTLVLGDDSVIMIDRATEASIDQLHRTGDTKVTRWGLGHGSMRAGVRETTLRSDMTITTPTATLSKKGTWDFGITYEASRQQFRIFLAREGLVEALNRLSGQRRELRPGQHVTQAMVRWIETARFDRYVPIADVFGLTKAEVRYLAQQDTGLALLGPGEGVGLFVLAGRNRMPRGEPVGPTGDKGPMGIIRVRAPEEGPHDVPEGNFGTGGAQLPSSVLPKHSDTVRRMRLRQR